ncbi:MAG: hypothetical protein R3176_06085 [Woeseiaceae bacterium]|nr:hypothetical protein [Woeseiaceae bacterium]
MFRRSTRRKPVARAPARTVLLLALLAVAGTTHADEAGPLAGFLADVQSDFRIHYSPRPLLDVAAGFAVSAVLANGDADDAVQATFRDRLHGATGSRVASFGNGIGDAAQPLSAAPVYLAAMWLGRYGQADESVAARWAGNSLRSMLVASPQLIVLSRVSGGSRPGEGDSDWDGFADDNGVSGHAFYGAIPLLSATRLTDRRWAKVLLYGGSALPGLARVQKDKHYFSQSLMGWWLAFSAARSVARSNDQRGDRWRLSAVAIEDGVGLGVRRRFD